MTCLIKSLRAVRFAVIGGLCALVYLVAPFDANGASRWTRPHLRFHLAGTRGFQIQVNAAHLPFHGRPDRVRVTVFKAGPNSAGGANYRIETYEAGARFTSHKLAANLGRFGRIQLQVSSSFGRRPEDRAHSRTKAGEPDCTQISESWPAHLVGQFRLISEGAVTTGHARRLRGRVERYRPLRCHGRQRGVRLVARSHAALFTAKRFSDGTTLLQAKDEEVIDRVSVERITVAIASASSGWFDASVAQCSASVAPLDSLFTGKAEYGCESGLTGDLTAHMLGEGDISLTGPRYSAHLRRF
jgi:hypothetical protein